MHMYILSTIMIIIYYFVQNCRISLLLDFAQAILLLVHMSVYTWVGREVCLVKGNKSMTELCLETPIFCCEA